jgi:nucleoside-triphosphatase
MGDNVKIGISGLPRSGKSSTISQVLKRLEAQGELVGGMVTDDITENGVRVGIKIRNVMTGEEGVLAHKNFDSWVRVGEFGVDLNVIDSIGVRALEEAGQVARIVAVDEVGKMEMESTKFIEAVKNLMEDDKLMIMTLHKRSRDPLLQEIRRRDDVRILEVTPLNRNLLPIKIERILSQGEI